MTDPITVNDNVSVNGLFPIRTVASLTGINPITLRAWERRYKLITPQRTPKGHRMYTQTDIDRIQQIIELLDKGISIGQVAPLLNKQTAVSGINISEGSSEVWQTYLQRMLEAISDFNLRNLDATYNDALSLYPLDLVNTQLISPLLKTLGKQWSDKKEGIAEEHFFSSYLRNKLGARIHHLNIKNTGPLIITSCLPEEQHELGLLFFVLAAVSNGYRVIILGANLPLDQIPAILQKRSCAAIVLSGSSRPSRKLLNEELPALVQDCVIPVMVGGTICDKHQETIESAGCISLGMTMQTALEKMAQVLSQQK